MTAIMKHLATHPVDLPIDAQLTALGSGTYLVTKSLRERARQMTRLDGSPFPLKDHPQFKLFSGYFDQFEAVEGDANRLKLLAGSRALDTFAVFRPMVTVFSDKVCKSRLDDDETEQYLALTWQLVKKGSKRLEG